jgi:hypothetical protein
VYFVTGFAASANFMQRNSGTKLISKFDDASGQSTPG